MRPYLRGFNQVCRFTNGLCNHKYCRLHILKRGKRQSSLWKVRPSPRARCMWRSGLQTGALQGDSRSSGVFALQVRNKVKSTLSTFPYSFLLPFRSETHWLVSENEKAALFKAPVGLDPIQPPSTGWQFSKEVNFEGGNNSDANS